MQNNSYTLYVEINLSNLIFFVGKFDNEQKFVLKEKFISNNNKFKKNKFLNVDEISEFVEKNIKIIEDKLDCIFVDVIVIVENFNLSCINVSSFKKLNGSQLLKENISYILNSLKLDIIENNNNKRILHIFNSRSVLDGVEVKNIPIGLFGNFYTHELTFFLIENNEYKNIQQIFKKNNLNIKKLILKNYCEGINFFNQNSENENFILIKVENEISQINFFENLSFRYSQTFNFGTNIILKDISKICSISNQIIEKFLEDNSFNNLNFNEKEILEEKYFENNNFRKVRKSLIFDIANARIEEMINILFSKNNNLQLFKKKRMNILLEIKKGIFLDNFKASFQSNITKKDDFNVLVNNNIVNDEYMSNVAHLANFGWKKEAIPTTKIKSSIITRIFKSIFG